MPDETLTEVRAVFLTEVRATRADAAETERPAGTPRARVDVAAPRVNEL
ncbi:hypothetical protein [Actinomadura decatromicini]|nr:hypothetical protein [Actinomadura decatromicini]